MLVILLSLPHLPFLLPEVHDLRLSPSSHSRCGAVEPHREGSPVPVQLDRGAGNWAKRPEFSKGLRNAASELPVDEDGLIN